MKKRFHAGAFSLIEVTLALAVTSFCLVAIFGLLPVGLKVNQASIEQTAANGILSAVTADLRATPRAVPPGSSATTSQQFSIVIPANPVSSAPAPTTLYFTSDGRMSKTLDSNARYLLTATFQPNGSSGKSATLVNLRVSWPADAASATGSVQSFVALDRN